MNLLLKRSPKSEQHFLCLNYREIEIALLCSGQYPHSEDSDTDVATDDGRYDELDFDNDYVDRRYEGWEPPIHEYEDEEDLYNKD